ncbi:integrator complex subunit 7 [Aplysia californica]|uniref:Integrator complex subunit 7 n=1 Tax=Aplysia californica TaxID=6500 RepID=A0ABM1W0X1_APLCA|nr:integrator complex subunit 7 [Aplysia californica]
MVVVTEHAHFWLLGLHHACAAENRLWQARGEHSELLSCIGESLELFVKSHVALKAASSPTTPLDFASAYINLRMRALQAHHTVLLACTSFRAKPPPAIAMALATNSGQEGTRWAQVVQQVGCCVVCCCVCLLR